MGQNLEQLEKAREFLLHADKSRVVEAIETMCEVRPDLKDALLEALEEMEVADES